MKPILILDVDGVVFDSNIMKENNIKEATLNYVDKNIANDFVSYYTKYNGVPREVKINNFFKNKIIANGILKKYNELNKKSLKDVEFTKNAFLTLKELSEKYSLIALSGGDQRELIELFKIKRINTFFDNICGGPNTKSENLKNLKLEQVVCFIGDSKIDFEVANEFGIPFIFMKTYTQFNNWKQYFKNNNTQIISYINEFFETSFTNN